MSSSLPSAFIFSSSFVPTTSTCTNIKLSKCSRRSPQKPNLTVAVLDTPASNSYLQQHAEVALRNFLTRRAVNTVMYYMDEMRDTPSKRWLSNFENFVEKVHTDKFNDGDAFLQRMMMTQNEKGVFKIKHPRAYLSRTYHFTIEPHRIAKRIYSVRDHLANEWAHDLVCIKEENNEIQRMCLERRLTSDEKTLNSKRNLIFDSDPMTSDSTPLRHKNYIALKTLTTRHAVARLLPYIRDHGSNHEYMYLLGFVNTYGSITDGDKFIKQLMERPIETRTHPDHLIQPHTLAVQVLETRLAIAKEWITVMQFIPQETKLMNRSILERSMQISHHLGEDFPSQKPNLDRRENETSTGTDEEHRDHSL